MDLRTLIESVGYLGITGIVFAESGLFVGAFLPGDSLLFTAGFLASQGIFDIRILMLLTFIAAVVGDSVGYAFGRHMGPKIFNREDSLLFHRDHLMHAEKFYEKHGGKTIIIARFMPVVRTFAPILAGVGRMHYPAFLMYNVVGGLLWAVGLSYLGYFLGNSIPNVDRYLLPIIGSIILVSIAPSIIHLARDHQYRHALIASFMKYRTQRAPTPSAAINQESSREVSSRIPHDYRNVALDGFAHVTRNRPYTQSSHRAFMQRFMKEDWCKENIRLAQKTTFRLGGPADIFVTPKRLDVIQAVIRACRDLELPLFILGGGSNVLFSDAGWRGVVLQPTNTGIAIGQTATQENTPTPQDDDTDMTLMNEPSARWETIKNNRPIPPHKPLVPSDAPLTEVIVGAGTSLQQLILRTHQEKLVGLESFSGIPARVGGALRNNVHGGPDNFDRYVKEATLLHRVTGDSVIWPKEKFAFSYDHSILQQHPEWIVWELVLNLSVADDGLWQAFDTYLQAWQRYKTLTQTAAGTAGCIYKNLDPRIAQQHRLPASAGAIIDQYIGLGAALRTVHVSTFHGNFLQNIADQQGTSEDMLSLINYIRAQVQANTRVLLEPEIEMVGF